MAKPPYTTQLQAGLGLIHETRTLLDLWQPGMTPTDLKETALASGLFPQVAARRLRNVVIECFKPRYMVDDCRPAGYLKVLKPALSSSELTQLFFLYTCRANPILGDFVRDVYWPRFAAGADLIEKLDVEAFIRRGIDDGKTEKPVVGRDGHPRAQLSARRLFRLRPARKADSQWPSRYAIPN